MAPLDTPSPGWTYVLALAGVLGAALLAGIASVLVVWLPMRNERAIANQEADLVRKLDATSKAAKDLQRLIDARVARWTRKAFKQDKTTGREITSERSGRLMLFTGGVAAGVIPLAFGILQGWSIPGLISVGIGVAIVVGVVMTLRVAWR